MGRLLWMFVLLWYLPWNWLRWQILENISPQLALISSPLWPNQSREVVKKIYNIFSACTVTWAMNKAMSLKVSGPACSESVQCSSSLVDLIEPLLIHLPSVLGRPDKRAKCRSHSKTYVWIDLSRNSMWLLHQRRFVTEQIGLYCWKCV